MLPRDMLRYLKGHPDAIVTVILSGAGFGALGAGAAPWPVVAALGVLCGFYHLRRSATERHQEALAQAKVDGALAAGEAVKTRHRKRLDAPAPSPSVKDGGDMIEGPGKKGSRT